MTTLASRSVQAEQPASRRLFLFASALVVIFSVGLMLGIAFQRDDAKRPPPTQEPVSSGDGNSHDGTHGAAVESNPVAAPGQSRRGPTAQIASGSAPATTEASWAIRDPLIVEFDVGLLDRAEAVR